MRLDRNLKEKATWWAASSNGFGGSTFAAPVLIDCRWEDRQELIADVNGLGTFISNARVYVDRDVSIGDLLILGDSTSVSDPGTLARALKIRRFDKVTDLRSVNIVRRAIL